MANSKDVVIAEVSTGIGWRSRKVLVSKGFRVFGSVCDQADADRLQSELSIGFVPLMINTTDADAVHRAAQNVTVPFMIANSNARAGVRSPLTARQASSSPTALGRLAQHRVNISSSSRPSRCTVF